MTDELSTASLTLALTLILTLALTLTLTLGGRAGARGRPDAGQVVSVPHGLAEPAQQAQRPQSSQPGAAAALARLTSLRSLVVAGHVHQRSQTHDSGAVSIGAYTQPYKVLVSGPYYMVRLLQLYTRPTVCIHYKHVLTRRGGGSAGGSGEGYTVREE